MPRKVRTKYISINLLVAKSLALSMCNAHAVGESLRIERYGTGCRGRRECSANQSLKQVHKMPRRGVVQSADTSVLNTWKRSECNMKIFALNLQSVNCYEPIFFRGVQKCRLIVKILPNPFIDASLIQRTWKKEVLYKEIVVKSGDTSGRIKDVFMEQNGFFVNKPSLNFLYIF